MPNRRVLWFPAAIVVIFFAVLIAFGFTGSSTGFLHQFFATGSDPALVSGTPQAIRSDEWSVQTAWTISQVEQGLPIESDAFPGGFDTTVQSDLPSSDWSVVFRPHLWGFFVLPLANAMAFKWWLPAAALVLTFYWFAVSLLPRRPVTAMFLSIGFFFAPFFQWWYLPVTFWPVAWSLAVMTAAVWLLRSRRRAFRLGLAVVAGYLTVTTAVGVYVPFIVPCALVAAFFVVGYFLTTASGLPAVRRRWRRLLPLFLSGGAALAVIGIWALTRAGTISRFMATVYPGQRSTHAGSIPVDGLLALFSAPVSRGLGVANGVPLGQNASEASTFFLIGLFLVVPLAWFVVRRWRLDQTFDWLSVMMIVGAVLLLAFMFVPGWDAVAHLLLLDRSTGVRVRIGLGLVSMVLIVLTIARGDETMRSGAAIPWWPAMLSTASAAASIVLLWIGLQLSDSVLVTGVVWLLTSSLVIVATLAFSLGRAPLGALALLCASLMVGSNVNPMYIGVFDLNKTAVVKAMKARSVEGERWVGVGSSFLPNAVLIQSGLTSFNGFQGAPSPEMWKEIDPSKEHEEVWNRLANVSWVEGAGEPVPSNPAPDQILLQFDSCSDFAQMNVEHVVSDRPLTQPCLADQRKFNGPTPLWIYDVAHTPVE